MFGKKILSIIGSLFFAGYFVKAANVLTSTCEPTFNTNSDCTGYYCINESGEIYSMGTTCNSVQLDKGIYIFDVKTQASDVVKIGDLGTYTPDSSGENLAMYSCDSEKVCRPLSGYVKLGEAYYKVITGASGSSAAVGELSDVSQCNGNVGKLGNLDPSAGGGDRKRAANGVICVNEEDSDAVPLIGAEGNSYLIDTNTEFGSSSKLVAKFSSDGKIITAITVDGSSNYLIEQGGNTVIYDTSKSAINTDYMNYKRNYCVDDNMVVRLRKEDLCASDKAGDCTYYDCNGTTCSPNSDNYAINEERDTSTCVIKNSSPSCDNGYYIITAEEYDSGSGESWTPVTAPSENEHVLIECTGEEEAKNCHVVGGTEIPIGFLSNVGNGSGTAPYIQCLASGACTPVAETAVSSDNRINSLSNSNKYIISIDSEALLGIDNAASTYVVVEKKDDNIKVIKSGSGYYTTSHGQSDINATGSSDLYTCTDGNDYTTCTSVSATDYPVGYVKNVGAVKPYIKCTTTACEPYEPLAQGSCEDAKYGDLYIVEEGKVGLCKVQDATSTGNDLILSGVGEVDDNENYMASVANGKTQTLFGITQKDNYHIVLQFQDGNVTVEKNLYYNI